MELGEPARAFIALVLPALPLLRKVGEGAVQEVGAAATRATMGKLRQVWDRIALRLNADPASKRALEQATATPHDPAARQALASRLERLLKDDPRLASEVIQFVSDSRGVMVNSPDAQAATIGGSVTDSSIHINQDRSIHWYEAPRHSAPTTGFVGTAPFLPDVFRGRDRDLQTLKAMLTARSSSRRVVVVRGWPGIGKTATAAMLAHDPEIEASYPDGILWTSLGTSPNILGELASWGFAMGLESVSRAQTVTQASGILTAALRDLRVFLILDDVWTAEQALPLQIGGRHSATLVTTRDTGVAEALTTADNIHRLPELSLEASLEVLETIAREVVLNHRAECTELARTLEGLPLALSVAGHLLQAEQRRGLAVHQLVEELREGRKLLESQAPADRSELERQTTPTVALLLRKSTDRLDSKTRERFALLGAFAPDPATFGLNVLPDVWQTTDNPLPTLSTLLDRGLLETAGPGRYRMHSLLVTHARSLWKEG